MVRQHDAARTNADRRRAARDVSDEHGRGRTRDTRDVVVFGQPEPAVAQALGVSREIEAITKRCRGVAAFDDGGEVEDRERNHEREAAASSWCDRRGIRAGIGLARAARDEQDCHEC